MSRLDIEERLSLPLLTVCLAAVTGKEGDLRQAKSLLVDEVRRIVQDCENERLRDLRTISE